MQTAPRKDSHGMKGFTIKENLIMSPIEKHVYYNKFPFRLILNILLVVLVTAQVWIVFDVDAGYSRMEQQTFRYLFMGTTDDHTPIIPLNTPTDLQNHLLNVQDVYQNFNDKIFQTFNLENAVFTIQTNYKVPTGKPESYPVDMIEGFTDPFDINDVNSLKLFIENVVQMQIVATNLTVFNQATENSNTVCQNWTINVQYDIQQFTQILVSLASTSDLCNGLDAGQGETTSIVFSIGIIIVSIICLCMSVQKINSVSLIFLRVKAGYINFMNNHRGNEERMVNEQAQELAEEAENPNARENIKANLKYASWEEIPFTQKMKFFSPWFFFNIVGNIFQLVSSFIMVLTFYSPISTQDFYVAAIPLGFSSFFTWTQLLQYLKYWDDVTLITTTLLKSADNTKVYFGITIPIFMGISLLGAALFWKYDKFAGLGISLRSLWAMSGGDIVHETYLDTWDEGIISTVYLTIYMILFYTAFVNIFVAVIMEAYDKSKMRKSIDGDDPFPTADNLQPKEQFDLLNLPEEDQIDSTHDSTGYNLKGKLERVLASGDLSAPGRNIVNLLMYYNSQAKENICDVLRAKKHICKKCEDKTSRQFLENLVADSVNKIMERIFYLRLALKQRSRKNQPKQE